ncbi:MAG: DUF721 domain-containing protein [Firmicutes bacterium]|nr:DUF721 domain-containing protein [Bacillota bacterium]
MIPVSRILEQTLTALPAAKRIKGQMVMDAWAEVVGDIIAQKAEAVSFSDGILFVRVCDSVWAQHLVLQKKQIITKLKAAAKTNVLKDIYFQIGKPRQHQPQSFPEKQEDGRWRQFVLDEQDVTSINDAFAQVDLPADLVQSMKALFVAQKKRMKWLLASGKPACKQCGLPLVETAAGAYCLCCKCEDQEMGKIKSKEKGS